MDPCLSVLLDLLAEIGPDALRLAFGARPDLWHLVPRDALVALPWERTSRTLWRPAAGAATGLAVDVSGGPPQLAACSVRIVGEPGRARALSGRRQETGALVERRYNGTSEADAAAWCDAALLAAGWVLL